jgi:hypothetical protein
LSERLDGSRPGYVPHFDFLAEVVGVWCNVRFVLVRFVQRVIAQSRVVRVTKPPPLSSGGVSFVQGGGVRRPRSGPLRYLALVLAWDDDKHVGHFVVYDVWRDLLIMGPKWGALRGGSVEPND